MRWTCVIRALLASLFVTAGVSAQISSECVSNDVQKAALECPAGAQKIATGRRAPPKMTSAVEKKSPSEVQKPPPPPPIDPTERDKRNAIRKLRSLSLLVSETEGLERLLKRTPKKSTDRLQLLRRLAENYA